MSAVLHAKQHQLGTGHQFGGFLGPYSLKSRSSEHIGSPPCRQLEDSWGKSLSSRDLFCSSEASTEFLLRSTTGSLTSIPTRLTQGEQELIMSVVVTPPSTPASPSAGAVSAKSSTAPSSSAPNVEKLDKTLQKIKKQLEGLTAQRKDMERRIDVFQRGIRDITFENNITPIEFSPAAASYFDYTPSGSPAFQEDFTFDDVFTDSPVSKSPMDRHFPTPSSSDCVSLPSTPPSTPDTYHYKLRLTNSSTPPVSPLVQQCKTASDAERTRSQSAEVPFSKKSHSRSMRMKKYPSSELTQQSGESEDEQVLTRSGSFLTGKFSNLKHRFSKRKSRNSREKSYDV